MDTEIRVAGIEDLSHLLELMREYYAYEELPFDEDLAASALIGLLSDGSLGRVWLVSEGAVSIGYAAVTFGYSLEFGGRDAFIDELYLKEAYRGRGIGRRLMSVVESVARSLGLRAVHLEVAWGNEGARSFYGLQGFEAREGFHLMSKRL